MKKYVVEGVGTMFLVLAYAMIGYPFAIGSMLLVLMYAGSHISGGHYNPAVSLAMWMQKKISLENMFYYMTAQLSGGLVAAMICRLLTGSAYVPVPPAGVPAWRILPFEILFTFLFVFVFLSVMIAKKTAIGNLYGVVIGFALLTVAFLGGTYNPAVSFGPHLFKIFFNTNVIKYMPFHVVGSLFGGMFAAYGYRYLYSKKK